MWYDYLIYFLQEAKMASDRETRARLRAQYQKYPMMQISDIFKYIFQSSFGCEHLVSDEHSAIRRIISEYEAARPCVCGVDKLDGAYSRVHLGCIGEGMSTDTLGRLFLLSAVREDGALDALAGKLKTVRDMVREGELPFDESELEREISRWAASGYGALHHSDAFRAAYRPAYRVISDRFAAFLRIFVEIDKLTSKKDRVIIAIEGGSASGKTTLSGMLREVYGCNIVHMDDFFLRPEQRTAERFSEIGGNVDRERVRDEVLEPYSRGETVCYRPFECSTMTLALPITLQKNKLTVVEGAYSMHPELEGYYDLSVFLDITSELQRERIRIRNTPPMAERFFSEWIPLERAYFDKSGARERCDIVFSIDR